MVVPVLMMSCQVSEYLNIGPDMSHTMITEIAIINAAELPVAIVAQFENRSNMFFFFAIGILFISKAFHNHIVCIDFKKDDIIFTSL